MENPRARVGIPRPTTHNTEVPMSLQVSVIGFFWMELDDWDALLPQFVDRANFPAQYEHWVKAVENGMQKVARPGVEILKIRAEPDEFLGWCRLKGLDVNSHARTEYASEKAAAQSLARGEKKH